MSKEIFEGLFSDAVDGLGEYYGILRDPEIGEHVIAGLKLMAAEQFVATGNNQADYEKLRDFIGKAVDADADIVLDDINNRVHQIQSGGHASPKKAPTSGASTLSMS